MLETFIALTVFIRLVQKIVVLFTCCSFDITKNKFNYYIGKGCIKNLCKDLKEDAAKIISYKEMISLATDEKQSYCKHKVCHIFEKDFSTDENKNAIKNTIKSEIIVITLENIVAAHSICNLRHKKTFRI